MQCKAKNIAKNIPISGFSAVKPFKLAQMKQIWVVLRNVLCIKLRHTFLGRKCWVPICQSLKQMKVKSKCWLVSFSKVAY